MPALASYAFDIWLFEALLPLLSGASVRVVPRERVLDVDGAGGGDHGRHVLHAVPALMRQLVDEGANLRGALPTVLRRAFVGRRRACRRSCPAPCGRRVPAAGGAGPLRPHRGDHHLRRAPGAGGEAAGRHLIGRPLGNTRAVRAGRGGAPAPVGVPASCTSAGQGGAGLPGPAGADGGALRPDPLSAEPRARLYRTGDRARWRADGSWSSWAGWTTR